MNEEDMKKKLEEIEQDVAELGKLIMLISEALEVLARRNVHLFMHEEAARLREIADRLSGHGVTRPPG